MNGVTKDLTCKHIQQALLKVERVTGSMYHVIFCLSEDGRLISEPRISK